MKRHFLLIWLLIALETATTCAQAVPDTAAAKIAGQWEMEKVVVRETSYHSQVFLKEYTVTDKAEIRKLKAGLLTEIIFGAYRYEVTRKGGTETGVFSWTGRNMILLSRTMPAEPWNFTYDWEMPLADKLILKRPFSVYKNAASGQLVRADYTCHYSRKPINQ
jgi:hypothetical protein